MGAGVGKVICAWPRLGPFVDEIRRWGERQGAEIGGKRVRGKGEINLGGLVTGARRGSGPKLTHGASWQGFERTVAARLAATFTGLRRRRLGLRQRREAGELRKTERINSPFIRSRFYRNKLFSINNIQMLTLR